MRVQSALLVQVFRERSCSPSQLWDIVFYVLSMSLGKALHPHRPQVYPLLWHWEGHGVMFCNSRCLSCGFNPLSWCRCLEKDHVPPLNCGILFSMFCLCLWARHLTLTGLRCKSVPGKTMMAMCMIRSKCQNGCRAVCSLVIELFSTRH